MPTTALVKTEPEQVSPVQLFERFATDPNVSVEKIERLMALVERSEATRAAGAFHAAMAQAQQAMRVVGKDAENPQTHSRYASYEALDRALRPIYTQHGFALSFNTGEAPQADMVRILCDVMHTGGHAKPYHVDMPADGKGAKGGDVMTKTHATGSAISYGMRYLLKMIFNVAVGEADDDGNAAAGLVKPANGSMPAGFEDWWTDMCALADEGLGRLQMAFNDARERHPELVTYMHRHRRVAWEALKAKAQRVQK